MSALQPSPNREVIMDPKPLRDLHLTFQYPLRGIWVTSRAAVTALAYVDEGLAAPAVVRLHAAIGVVTSLLWAQWWPAHKERAVTVPARCPYRGEGLDRCPGR